MKDRFADRHPLVNFIYFALVIAFSMALQHPLAQGISLVCACAYAVQTEGRRAVRFCLKWCLPIALVTALANPLFSHRGMTVLLYFPFVISLLPMTTMILPMDLQGYYSKTENDHLQIPEKLQCGLGQRNE